MFIIHFVEWVYMIGPIVCPEKKWLINFFNSDPTKREKRKDEGNPEVSPELQIMKPKIAITVHNLLEKSMQIRMNWWKGTKTPNLFFNSKLKDAQQIKTYSVIYHWQKNLLHPTRTMQIKSLFPGTKKYICIYLWSWISFLQIYVHTFFLTIQKILVKINFSCEKKYQCRK